MATILAEEALATAEAATTTEATETGLASRAQSIGNKIIDSLERGVDKTIAISDKVATAVDKFAGTNIGAMLISSKLFGLGNEVKFNLPQDKGQNPFTNPLPQEVQQNLINMKQMYPPTLSRVQQNIINSTSQTPIVNKYTMTPNPNYIVDSPPAPPVATTVPKSTNMVNQPPPEPVSFNQAMAIISGL